MTKKEEVCELLDKLTIEMLDLIQQNIHNKIQVENASIEGQLLIAKSRYLKGSSTVSVSQLPTENTAEFNALATISQTNPTNELGSEALLELNLNPVDKANGYIDPINWFGILVPQCLQAARDKFQRSIRYACECANIQINLLKTMEQILRLRQLKQTIQ